MLLLGVPGTANAQFRDHSTGLVISPPDYLLRQGEDLLAPASVISCWYAPETEEYPWVRMCAERLDRLPRADEKLTFAWGGRTISGSRSRVRSGEKDLMQYSALVPLRTGTIRLDVVTPVRGSDDAKLVLEESLASLRDEGPERVARDGQRREVDGAATFDRTAAKAAGKIATGLIIVGIGMLIRDRRAKRQAEAPPGPSPKRA